MRGNTRERRGWMHGNGCERQRAQALEHERRRVPERVAARMMTHIDVRKRMRVLVQERTVQERTVQPLMWRNRSRALFRKPRLRTLGAQRVYEHCNSYNYQGK